MSHKLQSRIYPADLSLGHYLFMSFLLLVPLLAAFLWGPYFDDSVYSSFRFAQNLAYGRGLSHDAGLIGSDPPQSALTIGLLTFFTLWGLPPQLMLFLSALGWGVAAAVIYLTLRPHDSTVAVLVAILIVLSPIVTRTLASPVAWVVLTGWLVILVSIRSQNGWLVLGLMLLLLALWIDLSILALITLLLVWRWRNKRQTPRLGIILLAAITLVWLVITTLQFGRLFTLRPFIQLENIFEPIRSTELAWLFLPFLLLFSNLFSSFLNADV